VPGVETDKLNQDYGVCQESQKIGGRGGVKICAVAFIKNANAFGTGDAAKWAPSPW
jgi:hypothetical protein